jgi:hypothetical protein
MQTDENNRRPTRIRRLQLILLCVLGCLLVVALFTLDGSIGTHPRFGEIFETTAFDLNENRSNRLGRFLREHLPANVLRSPYFPDRFKDQPKYLHLGDTQLEWSISGSKTGWLYFWNVGTGPRISRWQFAPCGETNFMNVTATPPPEDFYGPSAAGSTGAFGSGSTTNAIKVAEGQILFARRTDDTNRVYVLKLENQWGNRLSVHYCVATVP